MNEFKIKHLEFIQNVITRMNQNSFLIKGWAITLTSALFALSAKDANTNYILIAYIPVPVFWLLDSFFLMTEKKYRLLYKSVALKSPDRIDFDMNIDGIKEPSVKFVKSFFSMTLLPFYGLLVLVMLIAIFTIGNGIHVWNS